MGFRLDDALSPKFAAFAGDHLFFVSNPRVSVPNLLQELKTYGGTSMFQNLLPEIGGAKHLHVGLHGCATIV